MSVQRPVVAQPELDLQAFFTQGPRVLRRSWFLATAFGEGAGLLVCALTAILTLGLHPGAALFSMALAGTVAGALMGTAQAVVLRREFLGFSRTVWTLATAFGAATALLAGSLPGTLAATWTEWSPWVTVPVGVVLASVALVSIGYAQWTVLRRYVARSRSWVAVNVLAWGVGAGALVGLCLPLWENGHPVLLVAAGVVGAALMALVVAGVTALWLARLVCPPSGRPLTPPGPAGVPKRDWTALAQPTDEYRVFDPTALDHLPGSVQRWLRHVVTPGTALLTGAETAANGHIRLAGAWRGFSARQRTALRGGYLWSGRSRVFGLSVVGVDRFTRDRGELRWRLPGRIRLARDAGMNATRSCAARHAAELFAAVPAVALHPSVRWEEVDHDHARAHLVVDDEDHAVTVTVDPRGRLRQVEVDRWGTPPRSAFGPYHYGLVLDEERRFEGYRVPTEVVAGWNIGTDRWEAGKVLRYRIVRCSFH